MAVALLAALGSYSGVVDGPTVPNSSTQASIVGSFEAISSHTAMASPTATDPYLYVNSTLVLENDSKIGGNFDAIGAWYPGQVLYDPLSHLLYVVASDSGPGPGATVVLVNLTTNEVVGYLDLPLFAEGLAFDNRTGMVFVAGDSSSDIAVINGTSDTLLTLVNVSFGSGGVLYDYANNQLYVTGGIYGRLLLAINATTFAPIAKLIIGGGPDVMALDEGTDILYVADSSSNNISLVDTATDSLLTNVSLSGSPYSEVFDSEADSLFVLSQYPVRNNNFTENVTELNTTTNEIEGDTGFMGSPGTVTLGPDADSIYASSSANRTIAVIDPLNDTVESWVSGPFPSDSLTYIPTLNEFVDASPESTLGVWNATGNVTVTDVVIGASPGAESYDYKLHRLYISDEENDWITVVNTQSWKEIATIPVAAQAYSQSLVYDPVQGETFAISAVANRIDVINDSTEQLVASIPVHDEPAYLVYDREKGEVFVSFWGWNHISVIKASKNRVVAAIYLPTPAYVSGNAGPFAYDPARGEVVVGNEDQSQLDFINDTNNTITAVTNLAGAPVAVGYDPAGGEIYAAMYGGSENQLAIVNDTRDVQIGQIEVGTYPDAVVYDARADVMVVANSYTSSVSVVGGVSNRVLATVGIYSFPSDLAYNPSNGEVYTANFASGSIQILSPGHVVSFTETGLPQGTKWSASLVGTQIFSTQSRIDIDAGPGSYVYSIGTVPGWIPSNETGTVEVGDANASMTVSWTPVLYQVEVSEQGLPAGVQWWMNLTSGGTFSSTSNTIDVEEPNGTYGFEASASVNSYVATGSSFTVNNSSVAIVVTFRYLERFPVQISEVGLPVGTSWWLNVSGGESFSSIGQSLSVDEPNGSFAYTVASANLSFSAPPGVLVVQGAPATLSIQFSLVTFAVTFSETNLPVGTSWTVRVGAEFQTSGTSSVVLQEPNGTFEYSVSSSNSSWSATGGVVEVSGSPQNISVTFGPVMFAVLFSEHGLPAGTAWTVRLGGESETSETTQMEFQETNGTYRYTIDGVPGWSESALPYTGQISVEDAPLSVVPMGFFKVVYSVTVSEVGLPPGSEWWLNVSGGTSLVASGPSITFAEPNGTYSYLVGVSNSSYSAVGGVLLVSGGPLESSVVFSPVLFSLTFSESGLPAGASWTVVVGSAQTNSTGASTTFSLSNGTYSFAIDPVAGYNANVSAGHVTISGMSRVIQITFVPSRHGSQNSVFGAGPLFGISLTGWILIGGVSAVALGTWAVLAKARRPRNPSASEPGRTQR